VPTIIDSFLVTLGLDPSGITHGVTTADADLAKLREAADATKQALSMAKMPGPKLPKEDMEKLALAAKKAREDFAEAQKHIREESKETAKRIKEDNEKSSETYNLLIEKAMAFFAVLAGGKELKEFFKHQQESQIALLHLSEITGKSVEELAEWSGSVRLAGGSAEEFQGSLKHLSGMLVAIEKNLPRAKRALKAFQAAGIKGINIGQHSDVFEVMDKIAERMDATKKGAISGAEAMELGRRMGMSEHTIYLFRMGAEKMKELRDRARELGTPTQEQAKAQHELEESQIELSMAQEAAGRIITTMITPAIKFLTEKFTDLTIWAKNNPELIKKGFVIITAGIIGAGVAAISAAPPLLALAMPILAIAAAAGALGYVLYELTKDWDQMGAEGVTTWELLENKTIDALGLMWAYWTLFEDSMKSGWGVMAGVFTGDTERMKTSWHNLMEDMEWTNKDTAGVLENFWDWFVLVAEDAYATVTGYSLTQDIKEAAAGWKMMWLDIKHAAVSILDAIIEKLADTGAAIAAVARALHLPQAAVLSTLAISGQGMAHANTAADELAYEKSRSRILQDADPEEYLRQRDIARGRIPSVDNNITLNMAHRPSMAAAVSHHSSASKDSHDKHVKVNTHVENVNVYTDAKDADGIAKDIGPAIQSHGYVDQIDSGEE
jgi:hypothetical protein